MEVLLPFKRLEVTSRKNTIQNSGFHLICPLFQILEQILKCFYFTV